MAGPRAKQRSSFPEQFALTDELEKVAKAIGVKEIGRAWANFRAHHEAVGSLMANWPAAWRTWCFREVQGFRK